MCAKRRTLFDPAQAAGPRKEPAVGSYTKPPECPTTRGAKLKIKNSSPAAITVSALVVRVKNALANTFPTTITVAGEISNLSTPASGHIYFSLKDAGASIGAAMWRARAGKLKFKPTDGMEVLVEGKIDVYDAHGKLQLYVERMTPAGVGALDLAFRQLKEKLEKEGLFDPARKKPLCRFPRGLGIVTSATGAAVRDIQRTLRRRWPGAEVFLYPSPVQGEGSAQAVAEGIRLLDANASRLGIDTIIVARGGGSLEDLWAFNEEPIARAIAKAHTPVISGVGHEVDVTICDLVADVRSATPTAAAELAVPDGEEVRRTLIALADRLARRVRDRLDASAVALTAVGRSIVFRDPTSRVRVSIQRIDELSHRLRAGLHGRVARSQRLLVPLAQRLAAGHPRHRLDLTRQRLSALQARLDAGHPQNSLNLARQRLSAARRHLEAMSYRSVLQRGFSVTRSLDGKIQRSVANFQPGQQIETELADGKIHSDVVDSIPATPQQANLPPRHATKPKQKPRKNPQPNNTPNLFDNL